MLGEGQEGVVCNGSRCLGKDRKGWCVMGPGAGGRTGRGVVGPGSELQDESILEMFLNNVNILNTLLNRTAGPGGTVENPPTSTGDTGSILGLGRFHKSQRRKACAPQLLKPYRL